MLDPLIYGLLYCLPYSDFKHGISIKTGAYMLQNPNITIRYKAAALMGLSRLMGYIGIFSALYLGNITRIFLLARRVRVPLYHAGHAGI
jgi:hypothetical protein